MKLEGIIPAMVTPFTKSGDLDLEALMEEASYMVKVGVHGLVIGGSTGEGHTLTKDELREACKTAKEITSRLVGGRFPVLAGVITSSTREAIEYALEAKRGGADGLQMTPIPQYIFKPKIEDHVRAFREVGESVGLPIVIYNVVPTNKLSAADLEEISEVKDVIGVKQSGVDIHALADVIQAVGDRLSVLTALDDMLLPSFVIGARGSICASNAVVPDLCVQLYNSFRRGDMLESVSLHWKILRIVRATVYGGPNDVHGDMPGRIKYAINAQGRRGGYPRAPFSFPGQEVKKEILNALKLAGKRIDAEILAKT